MFDIYSLAKPRVFKFEPHDGGSSAPSETQTVDSYYVQSEILNNKVKTISENHPAATIYPECVGRISASSDLTGKASKNVIDAFSDLGGKDLVVSNFPTTRIVDEATKIYRTEFRPKQGLHNLDFTTPAETPSDNPGGDAQAQ